MPFPDLVMGDTCRRKLSFRRLWVAPVFVLVLIIYIPEKIIAFPNFVIKVDGDTTIHPTLPVMENVITCKESTESSTIVKQNNFRSDRKLWTICDIKPSEIFNTPDNRHASGIQRDMTAPLNELEKELAIIAHDILHHPSLKTKDSLNRIFVNRMMVILKRQDSYDYRFDSIKTVSRIFPQDNLFRIFSWSITDIDPGNNFKNTIYFGFIQRRNISKSGVSSITLLPLVDQHSSESMVENKVLTPNNWFGALYYMPKNTKTGVLSFEGKVYVRSPIKGKKKVQKVKYYLLLGLNQNDIYTNYKIVDVLVFNPDDSLSARFGAPIFYVNGYPHCRKIFKYSDNSPFSLNYHYVTISNKKTGLLARRKKMIVFDHLAAQKFNAKSGNQEIGADGSMDALFFADKAIRDDRKGFFIYVKNVSVYIPSTQGYSPGYLRKQANRERSRLKNYVR